MHREPEVIEAKVPVEECFDCPGRITSKELAPCEKWHPPECLFYKTKNGCRFGEKCSSAHSQVDEQPSKRSKTNDDKSAVAMLKKNALHESIWQPVVKMARCILKVKEEHKTAFFSPSENWCLPAPSAIKPKEREFVVDSGASMHMISKKDLTSAEMDTLTTSCSPTTVITANGDVQTREEATVYVKELCMFLTMKVLENTSAVFSLGNLCDEHGYSYEWINGQKPHLIKNVFRIQCNTKNFVPMVVPGLSASSSPSLPSSTSMTPRRQKIDHSKFSSSSSTSTPMTSSTEIDHSNSDHPPAIVSSESVDRQVRGDPYSPETSEELLKKPTKIPKTNKK